MKAHDSDLGVHRSRLLDAIIDLSQRCYNAHWLNDCEFAIWQFVQNGPGPWGISSITQADIIRLKSLSERVNGWWTWGAHGEQFVLMSEWLRLAAIPPAVRSAIDAAVDAYRAKLEAETVVAIATHRGEKQNHAQCEAMNAAKLACNNAHNDWANSILREGVE